MKFAVVWWLVTTTLSGGSVPIDKYTFEYPAFCPLVCERKEQTQIAAQFFTDRKTAEDFMKQAPDRIKKRMKLMEIDE